MESQILEYFSQFDFDVRKTGDARFMDQKCTPDVVCFIADCVINQINEDQEFCVNDIWESQYFIKNTRAIFNKPYANNPKARHEYDKFIQQPLKMLSYAKVLKIEKRGATNYYRINNLDILDYVAQRERNTFVFLNCYFYKVLSDSGQWRYFEEYIKAIKNNGTDKNAFKELQQRFIRFMIGNTAINGSVEVRRIFPKILNVIAVANSINGSRRGHISKYAYTFSDLMYNATNWRDVDKAKTLTRQEAVEADSDIEQQEAYSAYYVQKAIALIKKLHTHSEVKDSWANGEATQAHHIFPQSEFPQIAHYIENLIKLTATQHYTKAHPGNKTKEINRDYQLTCLLAKADTIDSSLKRFGETYYRKESFVYVINVGLDMDMSSSLSFSDIKVELIKIYNAA